MIPGSERERVVWQAFPSWAQFSWLYCFAFLTAFRGLLIQRIGLPGQYAWIIGALVLLGLAAILRHWARYILTPTRLIIKNGYTHCEIGVVMLDMITSIELRQGPIAKFFGIGTLLIRARPDRELRLRGVKDPDVVEAKIRALLPTHLPKEPPSDA